MEDLYARVRALPVDKRMDFLLRAIEETRVEFRSLKQARWRDDTVKRSVNVLDKRLSLRELPCLSAVRRDDLPPGVTRTEVVVEDLKVKVFVNDKEGTAVHLADLMAPPTCSENWWVFSDSDSAAFINHFVMLAYLASSASGSDDDDDDDNVGDTGCDFYSYASTMCVNDDVAGTEALCGLFHANANVLRSTYLVGNFTLHRYEHADTSEELGQEIAGAGT